MKSKPTLKQIISFIIFIVIILIANNFLKNYLLENKIDDYNIHLIYKILSNSVLGLVSFFVAKNLDLINLGGLSNTKPKKLWIIIFPLSFLVLLNGLFLNSIPDYSYINLALLLLYCISIGFSEELSLRSVLLPLISNLFGNNKKAKIRAIFISSLIFGLLHLIKFDKGFYGEISQVLFATFIGVMFGATLLVIKRVYPLIIIHAVIDFVAKLDLIGKPIKKVLSNPMDIESAIFSVLLTLPCLFYGIYIIKKHLK
ncbi:MAG: CPBP family intramembrane glutamic endopeptidase [Flavobacteriaceae bacterium]